MSKVSDVFDDWARQGRAEGMERGHGKTAGRLMDVLPVGEGDVFVDLGCGNGWACRQAAAKGAEAHGFDVSEEMIERAKILGGAEYHLQDFTDLPFDNNVVDFIWSMEALYYAPDPDTVLAEAYRALRPGKEFHMVIDYYKENEASHSWPTDLDVPMDLRSETGWKASLEAVGFREVQSERLRATSKNAEDWKKEEGSLHVWGLA